MTLDPLVSRCITQSIVDKFGPIKIVIFGSYATGKATADSDLDILAIVNDTQPSGHEATVQGRIAIRKALKTIGKNMAFDFILSKQALFESAKSKNGTIQYVADQQGIVIYEH